MHQALELLAKARRYFLPLPPVEERRQVTHLLRALSGDLRLRLHFVDPTPFASPQLSDFGSHVLYRAGEPIAEVQRDGKYRVDVGLAVAKREVVSQHRRLANSG